MTRFPPLPQTAASAPIDETADARELEHYVPTGDPVDQQAAARLLRSQREPGAPNTAELEDWLAANPSHRAAFERHRATWAELDALPGDGIAALKASMRTAHAEEPRNASTRRAPSPENAGRRSWLGQVGRWVPQAAMAAVVLTVVSGGWLGWDHWQHQPTFSKSYATVRGQQLNVTLPDGSQMQLDTATRVDVTLYRQRREVRMPEGQAMFNVQADAAQPFEVLSGPLRITVVGTRFSVRNTAGAQGNAQGGVQVAVEEGRVLVAAASAARALPGTEISAGAGLLLTAGQVVEADAEGLLGSVAAVPAAGVAPWREGRVAFDGTPLALALAEFERYGNTGLRIDDPAVARLRLNGSFDVRKADNFATALTRALPVRLEKRGEQTVIVLVR